MVGRGSIAACLVALFVTVAATSAHTEPLGDSTPAVASGAYEAVAWIRVHRPAGSGEGHDEHYDSARQTLIERLEERLESPLILLSALWQPEIANLETVRNGEADPLAWLVAALVVTAPEKTDLIRVGLRGERADDLQPIVDAVAQAIVTDVVESEKLIRRGRRDRLEKKLKEIQTELRAKREARQALEKEASAGKPADQAARRKRLDESQQEIAQLERVSHSLVELLESTALDLTGPPTVQRVEAPKSDEMP